MSAWVVSKKHVELMAAAFVYGTRDGIVPPIRKDAQRVGAMLVAECVKSVSYRYPNDDVSKGELPGPIDAYYTRPYRFEHPGYLPTAAELLKAIDCYSYQSSEHPGWKTSAASLLCEKVRGIIRKVVPAACPVGVPGNTRLVWPEYEAAPWGFDAEEIAVCYAKADADGKTFVDAFKAAPEDATASAMSDWLMERGVLAEPIGTDYLRRMFV